MVADNPNFPTPPRPGQSAANELGLLQRESAELRAKNEWLTECVVKAQQHALEMGNKALELAATEARLRAEIEQLRGPASLKRHAQPGRVVMGESEQQIKSLYGDVRIELVNVLSCHPPLAEYRICPMDNCALQIPVDDNHHYVRPPPDTSNCHYFIRGPSLF